MAMDIAAHERAGEIFREVAILTVGAPRGTTPGSPYGEEVRRRLDEATAPQRRRPDICQEPRDSYGQPENAEQPRLVSSRGGMRSRYLGGREA
jgi:hypothetical protein